MPDLLNPSFLKFNDVRVLNSSNKCHLSLQIEKYNKSKQTNNQICKKQDSKPEDQELELPLGEPIAGTVPFAVPAGSSSRHT